MEIYAMGQAAIFWLLNKCLNIVGKQYYYYIFSFIVFKKMGLKICKITHGNRMRKRTGLC